MLMLATICMFGATLVLSVTDCFLKKHKAMSFLLQLFALTSLFCGTVALAHLKNNFSLYSILLIASIFPQFLTIFDLKEILKKQKNKKDLQKNEENLQNSNKKLSNFEKFGQSNGKLFSSLGIFLSSTILSVCGLILGLETIWLYVLSLAIALFCLFLTLILKKNLNIFDFITYIFIFLSVGLCISQILTVLVYSFNLKNILYCLGILCYAIYSICFITFKKFNYSNLIYLLSIAVLLSTFII